MKPSSRWTTLFSHGPWVYAAPVALLAALLVWAQPRLVPQVIPSQTTSSDSALTTARSAARPPEERPRERRRHRRGGPPGVPPTVLFLTGGALGYLVGARGRRPLFGPGHGHGPAHWGPPCPPAPHWGAMAPPPPSPRPEAP